MQQSLNLITRWTEEDGIKLSPIIVAFTKRKTLKGFGSLKLRAEEETCDTRPQIDLNHGVGDH